jgi:hypothetical protein
MSGTLALRLLYCHILCMQRNNFFPIPRFCLGFFENFLQVHSRDDRESMSLIFCLGIVKPLSLRTSLLITRHMFFSLLSMSLLFLSFIFQQKKKLGRRCRILFYFIFDSFSDIVCVFA